MLGSNFEFLMSSAHRPHGESPPCPRLSPFLAWRLPPSHEHVCPGSTALYTLPTSLSGPALQEAGVRYGDMGRYHVGGEVQSHSPSLGQRRSKDHPFTCGLCSRDWHEIL